tara:strand:+ start:210 stop:347 length:138 start_codon:yes stop_codon:yes gene_type:complete
MLILSINAFNTEYGQQQLKKGLSIIDTALSAGFADQAHFQRTFNI